MKNSLLLLCVLAVPSVAHEGHEHKTSKEFEQIKGLAGDWSGTAVMEGKKVPVATSFKVTSGGSAVVETMGAGTEHEMVNVYHEVDGKLMMTHYCAMGNAPQMKATKSGPKSLALEGVKANGIDPKTTPHMHGLSYSFADKDHFKATWTAVNMGGKEKDGPSVFEYARVK